MTKPIKILFGTAAIASYSVERQKEFLQVLERNNVKDLDTAYLYEFCRTFQQDSEKTLGERKAHEKFIIHTKAPAFIPGSSVSGTLGKDSVLNGAKRSLAHLGAESVETYFLHSPDETTPIEDTYEAIQELYNAGMFKHFGLSNFKPEDVEKIHKYASSKGYVVPTIYQGNYNPVARHYDTILFPILRKLKIAFYAYSPLAGGFLVKSADVITNGIGARWDKESFIGQLYQKLYNKPALLQGLKEWQAIADETGIPNAALAYRWVAYNSPLIPEQGDGLILGASSPAQLDQALKFINEGPLDASVVKKIDQVWETVKHQAPVDNFGG
ncbi:MAG: hypothetical protein M1827_002716 [Pycnora praestabilis]|nr:MAG: hypothetical protein M1827_002716 [Pycnora praestabilis]